MVTDAETTLRFETASRALARLVASFRTASEALACFHGRAETVLAVRSVFGPGALPQGHLTAEDGEDAPIWIKVKETAVGRVAQLFPVEEDYMDMLITEGEPLRIYTEHRGFSWSWDDIEELLREPESWNEMVDLIAFFKALWIRVDWDEDGGRHAWAVLQERFGWPGRCPDTGHVAASEFDFKTYSRLLNKAGLARFERILDLALCCTGSIFLDYGPDEWEAGMIESCDYTAENIAALTEQWADAQVRLEQYDRARELVATDPSIYEKLADLWERTCRLVEQHEKRRSRGKGAKPLAEVFTEGATGNDLPDPLLAPL